MYLTEPGFLWLVSKAIDYSFLWKKKMWRRGEIKARFRSEKGATEYLTAMVGDCALPFMPTDGNYV